MTAEFQLLGTHGSARRGRLTLAHGVVETPAFMPVGTYGTVKAMTPEELEGLGAHIVLGNTFHLMLRPGNDIMRAHGGLHGFMHWKRPILTDSGGFQVFSLESLRKITEEGVMFRSPIDGSAVRLTPEDSMDTQLALGSDIAMALDDCTPYPATEQQARDSMERSMRWAVRSHTHYYHGANPPGELFAIVQGGMHLNLRMASLEALSKLPWKGLAVGGLAVGEPEEERLRGPRRTAAAHAGGQSSLSHGRRPAHGHRRRRAARHRHVRLRDADAPRAQRTPVHLAGRGQHPQCRAPVGHRARWTRPAPATPARTSRAPTFVTSTAAMKSSARGSTPSHNLHYYLELMRDLRSGIENGTLPEVVRTLRGPCATRPRVRPRKSLWHKSSFRPKYAPRAANCGAVFLHREITP